MSDTFNPYHVWLGIPASEQPPNHYRLLGISIFEADRDVIEHAADRQMAHVRTFQSGRHGALSQQILNELASASLCLLNAEKKAAYDLELRGKLMTAARVTPVMAVPVAVAAPSPVAPAPAVPSPAAPMAVSAPVSVSAPVAVAAIPSGAPALPVGKPVLPLAQAVPKGVASAIPVKPAKPQAAKPQPQPRVNTRAEEVTSDLPEAGAYSSGMQIRVKRRRRNHPWQGAAVWGLMAGVVVIGLWIVISVLRSYLTPERLDQIWNGPSAPAQAPAPRNAPKSTAPPRPSSVPASSAEAS